MAKVKSDDSARVADGPAREVLREPAEVKYADELEWLRSIDAGPRPSSWRVASDSPR